MSTPWEKVDAGRYAANFHGHVIQAIRKDGRYERDERPYLAVVDKVPLEPGEWSLNRAKTKAMQHVLKNLHKAKADKVFEKLDKALDRFEETAQDEAYDPSLSELSDMLFTPDPAANVFRVTKAEPAAEPELVSHETELVQAPIEPESIAPVPGQFVISGMILADDLLATLATMKETLALIREHSDAECTVNLPPTITL